MNGLFSIDIVNCNHTKLYILHATFRNIMDDELYSPTSIHTQPQYNTLSRFCGRSRTNAFGLLL
jgi:hypothetical protein